MAGQWMDTKLGLRHTGQSQAIDAGMLAVGDWLWDAHPERASYVGTVEGVDDLGEGRRRLLIAWHKWAGEQPFRDPMFSGTTVYKVGR